jgi:hypothetical protein
LVGGNELVEGVLNEGLDIVSSCDDDIVDLVHDFMRGF